jgi:hypothetical protein
MDALQFKAYMRRFWEIVKSYIWWSYNRGSVHYDVMVTLILLFIFLTPRWVFHDKPVERRPHQSEVVVQPDGHEGFIYEVDAGAVTGKSEDEVRENLLSVIEPIAGEVEIAGYEMVKDASGHVMTYRVRVQR